MAPSRAERRRPRPLCSPLQLFAGEPEEPAATVAAVEEGRGAGAAASSSGKRAGGPRVEYAGNATLDESVLQTLYRDLARVAKNTALVLLPAAVGGMRRDPRKALRDWDLWGPLVFSLVLAIALSAGASKPEKTFALVFAVICAGAVVLTLNVALLGGNIIFFQSVSLLGYCIFPLDIAALLCLLWTNKVYNSLVLLAGIGWACWASVPFVSAAVSPQRRFLAVYPLVLLYISIGWLGLVRTSS